MSQSFELPDTLSIKYWSKSAGSDLEKSSKVTALIKELENTCGGKIEHDVLETDGLDDKEIPKRRNELGAILKMLDKAAELLKKIDAEANKSLADAKKAGKESAVRSVITSVKVFAGEVSDFRDEVDKVDEDLVKGNTSKKATAKPADPKAAALLKKQVERLGSASRKSIRDLQSGKIKKIPFVMGASKDKSEPFKPGKDWEKRSLIYLHPKATKATRSILQKLLQPSPIWTIGEATCADGKKIVFNCLEGLAANPKQLKDALKYQMKNYAPPLRVMKDNKVAGDEAGEGKDDGSVADADELEDVDLPTSTGSDAATGKSATPKDDDEGGESETADKDDATDEKNDKALADIKKRLANRTKAIQDAIVNGGNGTKDLKDWTVALSAALKNGSDAKEAEKLMKRIEARLDGQTTDEEVSPDLDKALKELAQNRKNAASGATRVAELIRKSYEGDPQQKKAAEGAARIDAANQKLLATNIEATIQQQLRGADTRKRLQLADVVQKVRDAIEKNDLLPDIDKSPFDPALNVVAPYVTTLKNVESMLRAGR